MQGREFLTWSQGIETGFKPVFLDQMVNFLTWRFRSVSKKTQLLIGSPQIQFRAARNKMAALFKIRFQSWKREFMIET